MSWTVEYDAEHHLVECVYAGHVTADMFRKGTAKAIGLAKKRKTNRFLIDDSKWEGRGDAFDLATLPDMFSELGLDHRSRGAVVLPPAGTEAEKDARFFETLCLNRGWEVRVFSEREEAISWLGRGSGS